MLFLAGIKEPLIRCAATHYHEVRQCRRAAQFRGSRLRNQYWDLLARQLLYLSAMLLSLLVYVRNMDIQSLSEKMLWHFMNSYVSFKPDSGRQLATCSQVIIEGERLSSIRRVTGIYYNDYKSPNNFYISKNILALLRFMRSFHMDIRKKIIFQKLCLKDVP